MDEYKSLKILKTECILIMYKEHNFFVLSQQIMLRVRMLIHNDCVKIALRSLLTRRCVPDGIGKVRVWYKKEGSFYIMKIQKKTAVQKYLVSSSSERRFPRG